MKKMRKTLALALCLIMCFGMLPTWALAEDVTPMEEPTAEMMQEEAEAGLQEQATEPEVPAEEPPVYEESAPEEAAEVVLPEPVDEVWPEETPDTAESAVADEPEVPTAEDNDSAEGEVVPVNAEATEPATEPDVQDPTELSEGTDTAPVAVVFTVTPEEAELLVYTKDEYDEKSIIDPEEDGSYLLLPGEYYYTLTAEEYVSVEEEKLEVEPSEEPVEIELTLLPVQPEDAVENTEEATLQATEEVEETATLMASSGTCGDSLSWTLDDEGTLTISGTGAMEDYSYQSSVPWASFREQIKKLIIEQGVTHIGQHAFSYCSGFTIVTLPDSVQSIGSRAFSYNSLVRIDIPSSVTRIGEYAFIGCTSMVGITIPSSVTELGEGVFCDSGLASINLPVSITYLPTKAFCRCKTLREVRIPYSVEGIGLSAFEGCTALNVVYYSGTETMWSQTSKAENNDPLYSVKIYYADTGPEYYGTCGNLMRWSFDPETNTLSIRRSNPNHIGLPLPEEDMDNGGAAWGWENLRGRIEKIVIGPDIYATAANAFMWCTALKSIEFSGSRETFIIQEGSFKYCTALETLSLPFYVYSIRESAFRGCSALRSVELHEHPTLDLYIHDNAFADCTSLTELVLPKSVMRIGAGAFSNCSALESFVIPPQVITIYKDCFNGCSSLSRIRIPASVTTIEIGAFDGCTALDLVHFEGPASVWRQISIYYSDQYDTPTNRPLLNARFVYEHAEYHYIIENKKAPTCAEEGSTGDIVNVDTGEIYQPGSTIPKTTDHTPDTENRINVIAPTYTTPGYTGDVACAVCGVILENGQDTPELTPAKTVKAVCGDGRTISLNEALPWNPASWYVPDMYAAYVAVDEAGLIKLETTDVNRTVRLVALTENQTDAVNCYINILPGAAFTGQVPAGYEVIPDGAFSGMNGLTEIELQDTVTYIGENAFQNSDDIEHVFYRGTREQAASIRIMGGNESLINARWHYNGTEIDLGSCGDNLNAKIKDGILYINGTGEISSSPWDQYRDDIEGIVCSDGVTFVGRFNDMPILKSVSLPSTVTFIGASAFSGCKQLGDINDILPSSVETIGYRAFFESGVSGSYSINQYLTSIGKGAFAGCDVHFHVFKSSYFSAGGNGELYDLKKKTLYYVPAGTSGSFELANTTESIGQDAFYGCNQITAVRMPTSFTLKKIGVGAFYGCTSLKTFYYEYQYSNPEVKVLDNAFYGCESLTSLSGNFVISSLGSGAFAGCSSLAYMNRGSQPILASSLVTIPTNAFENCTSLTEIGFPENLRYIRKDAFSGCDALKTVAYDSIEEEGKRASISIAEGNTAVENAEWIYRAPRYKGTFDDHLSWKLYSNGTMYLFGNGTMPDPSTSSNYAWRNAKSSVKKVVVTDTPERIGENAFADCTNLTTVIFESGVPQIESNSFSGVTANIYYPGDCNMDGIDTQSMSGWLTWIPYYGELENNYYIRYISEGEVIGTSYKQYNYRTELWKDLARSGYDFLGWSTSPDSNQVQYLPGAVYSKNESIVLYAVWSAWTVNYNANGGKNAPGPQTKMEDVALILSQQIPERAGYDFLGWGIAANSQEAVYQPGDTYLENTGIDLYAVWAEHIWDEGVIEKNPTCSEDGKQIFTCQRCGEQKTQNIPMLGHRWGEWSVTRDATCTAEGEERRICENDPAHIEIRAVTKLPHTPGVSVHENELLATCSAEGFYDEVTYCTVCREELSRETKKIEKLAHIPGEAARENEVLATCSAEGHYDEVTYCTVCREELSRETKEIEKLAHIPGEAVRENEVLATCSAEGRYDEVTYCTVCYEELSRETKTMDMLEHNYVNGVCTFCGEEEPITVEFEDVKDPSSYFYIPVYWAVSQGITSGKTATTFAPYDSCTRAQVMSFLYKAKGSPEVSGSNPFTDVKESDYFYKPVLWAVSQGITSGTSATTFSPYKTCTRAQVMTFLYKAMGSPEVSGSNPFTDVKTSDYFYNAVLWAVANGITNGTSATTFSPYNTCTRAQVMTFLYKAMN